MIINRTWAMASSETFSCKPIGEFVQRYLAESMVSIDPFSRNREWATYTNDLDPNTTARSHQEASEFLASLVNQNVKADLVIFDPPYSLEQCSRSYKGVGRKVTMRDTQIFGRWTSHKNLVNRLLTPDGVFLYFGWNSNGMGKKRGFEITELLLVSHGSAHNDTICIAEKRNPHYLEVKLGETVGISRMSATALLPGDGKSHDGEGAGVNRKEG